MASEQVDTLDDTFWMIRRITHWIIRFNTISCRSSTPHSPFGNFCVALLTSLSQSGTFLANQNLLHLHQVYTIRVFCGGWWEGGFIPPSVFHAKFVKNTVEMIPWLVVHNFAVLISIADRSFHTKINVQISVISALGAEDHHQCWQSSRFFQADIPLRQGERKLKFDTIQRFGTIHVKFCSRSWVSIQFKSITPAVTQNRKRLRLLCNCQ